MENLYESILKSTKTGKEAIIIDWLKEKHILDADQRIYVNGGNKKVNGYYDYVFVNKGKICFSPELKGTLHFNKTELRNETIPDYIKFGECPGISFLFEMDSSNESQLPDLCLDLSIKTMGKQLKPFSASTKYEFKITSGYKKLEIPKIDLSLAKSDYGKNADYSIYISGGNWSLDELKNLYVKNPEKRDIYICIEETGFPSDKFYQIFRKHYEQDDNFDEFVSSIFPNIDGIAQIIFGFFKYRKILIKDKKERLGWRFIRLNKL